jgi:hypothetical protein
MFSMIQISIIGVLSAMAGCILLETLSSDFALSNTFFHDPNSIKEPIREAYKWRFLLLPPALVLYANVSKRAFGKQEERARHVINVGSCVTYLLGLAMFSPLIHVDEAPVPNEKWCFAWVCTLLNFGTLAYHATSPHHPKFTLTASARFWMSMHVGSGVIEWLSGIVALLPWDFSHRLREEAAFVMAIAAIYGHVSSSFRHADKVQGSRLVMVLIYRLLIVLHFLSACQLLLRPHSDLWLANTIILFNTYVWVSSTT